MAFPRSDPLDVLRSDLNPCVVITDPTELAAASTDWRGLYAGRARAILRPGDVDEVARILAWASRTRTPVVPQGGNTSLSGGAVPDRSGSAVILTLSRLNQIRGLSADSTSIT